MPSNQTPIDKATYVVVDLETTGLDARTERITEIGAVKMIGGFPIETFEQLINPDRLIPPKITELTGITNEAVRDAPHIGDVLPAFADFAQGAVLVVHNAPFDMTFLNRAARTIGHKSFRNRYFDTKLIAQKLKPLLGFYRLANLAEHFEVAHKPCHRALPDALATAEVFANLIEVMKMEGLTTVDEATEFFYPKERYDFSYKKALAMSLPTSSGVYLMKDERGKVVYVGKAKDLKKRVRSYFYSGPKTERQLALLSEIKAIDHIKTGTEIGALLLESKLIKTFRPPYNVLGKRYRRYPFVHINYEDEFPTPKIVRKVAGKGFHYGPFLSTADLELLLEVTKDLYGLKQCDRKVKPGKAKQPCFYYQVNRCSGPCSGMVSPHAYRGLLVRVMSAFDGHPESLRTELVRRRDSASHKLHFEKAALLNRALGSLERTSKILEGIRNAKANLDFILIEAIDNASRIYLVEDGQLVSCMSVKGDKRDIGRLQRKVAKVYFSRTSTPSAITPEQIENLSLLTAYFHKRPVTRVKIGTSPADTLASVLRCLNVKRQPGPSTETAVCLDFQLPSPSLPAFHPLLSDMRRHS